MFGSCSRVWILSLWMHCFAGLCMYPGSCIAPKLPLLLEIEYRLGWYRLVCILRVCSWELCLPWGLYSIPVRHRLKSISLPTTETWTAEMTLRNTLTRKWSEDCTILERVERKISFLSLFLRFTHSTLNALYFPDLSDEYGKRVLRLSGEVRLGYIGMANLSTLVTLLLVW